MKTQKGQKLTIITVGQMLANTMRAEITISGEQNGEPIYRNKGKRNQYYFRPKKEMLVFEGWDLPIDSNVNEGSTSFLLSGAGLNLINREAPGDVEATRKWIEEHNLNEAFNEQRTMSLHHNGVEVARLYPELQNR
jgi:hypothetical protein